MAIAFLNKNQSSFVKIWGIPQVTVADRWMQRFRTLISDHRNNSSHRASTYTWIDEVFLQLIKTNVPFARSFYRIYIYPRCICFTEVYWSLFLQHWLWWTVLSSNNWALNGLKSALCNTGNGSPNAGHALEGHAVKFTDSWNQSGMVVCLILR